jgi:geranylgeranylglycerol-phosphate geranylgeranyltransferase
LIAMLRLPNCFMMASAVLVGYIVMARRIDLSTNIFFASLAAMMMTGFANVTNDLADLSVDLINEPDRPLPSGTVKVSTAKVFSVILLTLGLAFALITEKLLNLLLALVALISATGYNFYLKRTGLLGNTVVSLLVALPFLYGAALYSEQLGVTLVVLLLTAFLANLGREVQKGVVDVEGDVTRGIRTVAGRYGVEAARKLASALYISAVCLSPLPLLLGEVSLLYLPPILVTDLGFVKSSLFLLGEGERGKIKREKNLVLLWMASAQVAFVTGRYNW